MLTTFVSQATVQEVLGSFSVAQAARSRGIPRRLLGFSPTG